MQNIEMETFVKEQMLVVMSTLEINRMPTSLEVRRLKIPRLDSAISKTGGYTHWAKKLNLKRKEPTSKWTDDSIKSEILSIIDILDINRMPSRSEIETVGKNKAIVSAIARSYGYYGWAERLGLDAKESDTLMGITYEKLCMESLKSKGYSVKDTAVKAPYDLIINGNVKIDVKSGTAYESRGSRVHTFGINKPLPVCDLYIIYALDEERENIERTFIIPSKDLKLHSMSIGADSKYNKYINRWDFIDQYDAFYKSVS